MKMTKFRMYYFINYFDSSRIHLELLLYLINNLLLGIEKNVFICFE